MLQQLMQTMHNNPMFRRAQQMAEGKNEEELRQTALNLCKQMGFDFDEMQKNFRSELEQMQKFMNSGRR